MDLWCSNIDFLKIRRFAKLHNLHHYPTTFCEKLAEELFVPISCIFGWALYIGPPHRTNHLSIRPSVRPSLFGTFVFCRLFHGFYFVVVDSFVGFPGNGDGGGGSGVVVADVCTSISPYKE